MSRQHLHELIEAASARGILPANAQQEDITRPWPIVLMSALGAWLVAIPFAVLVIVQAGNALNHGPMAYFLGAVFLAMAVLALQVAKPGSFVEQMALPSLLVASYLFALRLYQDLPHVVAGALLALLFMAMAWIVRQHWLRVLMGALACVAVMPPSPAIAGWTPCSYGAACNAWCWSGSRPLSPVIAARFPAPTPHA